MADVKLSNEAVAYLPTHPDRIRMSKMTGSPITGYTTFGWIATGWTEVDDTWVYATASTITIPTNGTLIYQKGMKVRLKQGGAYKYFVVVAVTATLITVMVNTDFTVANAQITDVAYSYIELPFGWPDWFNFTPVIASSAGAITSYSVVSAKARIAGKKWECFIEVSITNNGTGSGTITATLPVTPATILSGTGRNSTTGGKQLEIFGRAASGAVLSIVDYSGAYPAATGDTLRFWGNCDL